MIKLAEAAHGPHDCKFHSALVRDRKQANCIAVPFELIMSVLAITRQKGEARLTAIEMGASRFAEPG